MYYFVWMTLVPTSRSSKVYNIGCMNRLYSNKTNYIAILYDACPNSCRFLYHDNHPSYVCEGILWAGHCYNVTEKLLWIPMRSIFSTKFRNRWFRRQFYLWAWSWSFPLNFIRIGRVVLEKSNSPRFFKRNQHCDKLADPDAKHNHYFERWWCSWSFLSNFIKIGRISLNYDLTLIFQVGVTPSWVSGSRCRRKF